MKKQVKLPEEIERPGVMIYFGIKNVTKRMSYAQKGQFFEGLLEYAENGTEPDFSENDIVLCIAWDVTKPLIDEDKVRYFDKCASAAYAAYCRFEKEKGRKPIPMDAWKKGTLENGKEDRDE